MNLHKSFPFIFIDYISLLPSSLKALAVLSENTTSIFIATQQYIFPHIVGFRSIHRVSLGCYTYLINLKNPRPLHIWSQKVNSFLAF